MQDNTSSGSDNGKSQRVKDYIKSQEIHVTIEPDRPKTRRETLSDVQNKSMNISRMSEQALVQENVGASIALRKDGQINLASSKYSQQKVSPNGTTSEVSLESNVTTNRRNILTDEITINHRKMNPNLSEYGDLKFVQLPMNEKAIVGMFCVGGSIMVKAWEEHLKRYMLIRRPCRMPMFGTTLNVPGIHPGLDIEDPLNFESKVMAYNAAGYQVNGKISDSKSLIGKEGVDRDGINRNEVAYDGSSSTTPGANGPRDYAPVDLKGNTVAAQIWHFLKKMGYDDNAAAGIMGNIQAESGYNPGGVEADGGYGTGGGGAMTPGTGFGLCQWTIASRQQHLADAAAAIGKSVYDVESQLSCLRSELESDYTNCLPAGLNGMSIEDATKFFMDHFEGPNESEELNHLIKRRIPEAHNAFDTFAGKDDDDKKDDKKS